MITTTERLKNPTAPKQMQTILMSIGPDEATRWLELNIRNRTLDNKYVNYLASEMKAGRWKSTHQGIAFDVNGVLQDGQHRLWAIVMSGCFVEMNVTFNLPEKCIEDIDGGKKRMVHERMTLSGRIKGGVNKDQLAALRAMIRGLGPNSRMTFNTEMVQFARHKQVVDFAIGNLTTNRVKGVGSSITRGVVARAWYSVDMEKLRRFCEVLRTGMAVNPAEATIILLRDYLSGRKESNAIDEIREQYGKVERTLAAFLTDIALSSIRPSLKELFPLAGEEEAKAA
ncbi:MAG: hypothetical protein HZA50_10100 [Planctomycetes bacterium]|nr:hypothetical protein [Planctomycetota bacterium]